MRILSTALPLLIGGMMVLSRQALAQPTTLTFDNLSDSTTVTNQFQGLAFQNAAAISAGISLNEFEFPPHSGANVVFDSGGAMTITFSSPIQSFAGYFTYSVPLTIQALGSTGSQIVSASSRFSSNEALSGVPGSSPNELIQLDSGGGGHLMQRRPVRQRPFLFWLARSDVAENFSRRQQVLRLFCQSWIGADFGGER